MSRLWLKHMYSVLVALTWSSMQAATRSKLCRRDSAWVGVFAISAIVYAEYLLVLSFASLKSFSFIKSINVLSIRSRQIKAGMGLTNFLVALLLLLEVVCVSIWWTNFCKSASIMYQICTLLPSVTGSLTRKWLSLSINVRKFPALTHFKRTNLILYWLIDWF